MPSRTVNHRFLQRVGDGDDHCGVLAGRIVRLVILGLEVAAFPVQQQK
jgi:hypothetical protein